jgi:predicted GNAT family N-acyltransferase
VAAPQESLLTREILVGDGRVTVAAIGGVATAMAHRRQGYAHRLVETIEAFVRAEVDVDFLTLQCEDSMIPFYAAMGWEVVEQPLFCTQRDGQIHRSPDTPMVRVLGDAAWPDGPIDMNGLPW